MDYSWAIMIPIFGIFLVAAMIKRKRGFSTTPRRNQQFSRPNNSDSYRRGIMMLWKTKKDGDRNGMKQKSNKGKKNVR